MVSYRLLIYEEEERSDERIVNDYFMCFKAVLYVVKVKTLVLLIQLWHFPNGTFLCGKI
jgi:hypothetical protein